MTYYSTIVTLWLELDRCYEDSRDKPNNATRFKKRKENDRVYMLLAGPNEDLDEVVAES